MALARFLVDKSALGRVAVPAVAEVVDPLLSAGLLAVCGMTALELLYSARTAADHARLAADIGSAYEWLITEDDDFIRAMGVQGELARTSQHRAVPLPDLLIAAVAERHRVTVLHYDSDFDLVAAVTGQPMQWVVPRGTI